jgi:hypothetical protein
MIVRVEPTIAEGFVTRRRRDIRLKDWPPDVQMAFTKIYMPFVIEFTGCIDAWTSPSDEELSNLWYKFMPHGIHDEYSTHNKDRAVEVLASTLPAVFPSHTYHLLLRLEKGLLPGVIRLPILLSKLWK